MTDAQPGGVVIDFPTPPGTHLHNSHGKGKQMPFGLQTKSLAVGLVLGALIVPRVVAYVGSKSAK